jgi:predicted RNase H-like HicB family nuclease
MMMNKYGFNITWSDEDQSYIVTCPEFPGLSAFGETVELAIAEAKVALELFEETYQSEGIPLPKPKSLNSYSGQFRLRLPSTLHCQLARVAEQEGVSLNQFIVTTLATRYGSHQTAKQLENLIEQMETRLVKRTAANNVEWVVALMKAWDKPAYTSRSQSRSTAALSSVVMEIENLEAV